MTEPHDCETCVTCGGGVPAEHCAEHPHECCDCFDKRTCCDAATPADDAV